MTATTQSSNLDSCIQACLDCLKDCENCATACLNSDIESFAESFEKYDLITQKIKPYAKVYPFAKLAIALGFLSGVAPLATGITSLFIGVSGGISVIKAVYIDKLALNCACVGGNSKAPLGIVSFTENAIMAIMGGVLLFNTFTGEAETTKIKEAELAAVVRLQDANN